jgi:hypothetical protein
MTNNTNFACFAALLAASLFAATLPASYGCAALRAENAASTEELSRLPGFRSDRPIAPPGPQPRIDGAVQVCDARQGCDPSMDIRRLLLERDLPLADTTAIEE